MNFLLGDSLGIYIHIPFCRSKCPYCSFYSLNGNEEIKSCYIKKVCDEIKRWGNTLKSPVDTVYFGGGTPSLIKSDEMIDILKSINENFNVVINPEITMEVNPADYESVDFEKLKFFGLNRVSIGAQSLDNHELKILGRRHNVNDVFSTYEYVKKAGINNISIDFIIGFPEQNLENLDRMLNFCRDNNIPHVSFYLLKVEENTPYYFNEGLLKFPSDDVCSNFYLYISENMKKIGYNHYEISNFALPGKESKHNLKYWNLENYLGIGPSAHSLIGNKRFYYEDNIYKFNKEAKILSEGIGGTEEEYLMLRLRLSEGIKVDQYESKFKVSFPQIYFERIKKYEAFNLVKFNKNEIKLTNKGFLLSNKIISDIII